MASCVFNGDLSLSPLGTRPRSLQRWLNQSCCRIPVFVQPDFSQGHYYPDSDETSATRLRLTWKPSYKTRLIILTTFGAAMSSTYYQTIAGTYIVSFAVLLICARFISSSRNSHNDTGLFLKLKTSGLSFDAFIVLTSKNSRWAFLKCFLSFIPIYRRHNCKR